MRDSSCAPTPLAIARPRGTRLLQARSPKLERHVQHYGLASFQQWICLEADPTVSVFGRPCSDTQAAERLNEMGYTNWRNEPFTWRKVCRMRHDHKKSRYERLRARGLLTTEEIAQLLGICIATVSRWGRLGVLQHENYGGPHHCLYLRPDERAFVRPIIGRPPGQPCETIVPPTQQEAI